MTNAEQDNGSLDRVKRRVGKRKPQNHALYKSKSEMTILPSSYSFLRIYLLILNNQVNKALKKQFIQKKKKSLKKTPLFLIFKKWPNKTSRRRNQRQRFLVICFANCHYY